MKKLSTTKILLILLILFIVIQSITQFKKGFAEGINDGRKNRKTEQSSGK